jgi:hypothetical protein
LSRTGLNALPNRPHFSSAGTISAGSDLSSYHSGALPLRYA